MPKKARVSHASMKAMLCICMYTDSAGCQQDEALLTDKSDRSDCVERKGGERERDGPTLFLLWIFARSTMRLKCWFETPTRESWQTEIMEI